MQEVNIEKEPLLRLIVMGKKSLPDPTKKGPPYWGFVEMVTTNIEDVKTTLKGGYIFVHCISLCIYLFQKKVAIKLAPHICEEEEDKLNL